MVWLLWALAWAGPDAAELIRTGQIALALPVAKAEAEAAPASIAAQEQYIDLLLSVGLVDLADSEYRQRATDSDTADDWYLLGRAVRTAADAEAAYRAALKRDPEHARAWMGLGAVHRAAHRYDDAVSAYSEALSRDRTLGEAWAGMWSALLALGRDDAALEAAQLAVVNLPGEAEPYLAVSVLAPERKASVVRDAVKAVPGDARVHAALSELLLEEGDGAGAAAAARDAIRIDPTRSDARLSLLFAECMAAGTLDKGGYRGMLEARAREMVDLEGAEKAFGDLVEKYGKCPLPWMGRARPRAARGDVVGARKDLGKALELDPANTEVMGSLGLLLLQSGRTSEARPLLERAATERPHDVSLAIAVARVAEALGDIAGSKATLAAAIERFPYDERPALQYARLLSEGGDREGAYLALRAAAGRIPTDRLILGLAAAAKDLGKYGEAGDMLDILATRSGKKELADLARRVRAGEFTGELPKAP